MPAIHGESLRHRLCKSPQAQIVVSADEGGIDALGYQRPADLRFETGAMRISR